MTPRYDFSVQLGDTLDLQCTVHNPDSLFDVINGSVVFKKDGYILLCKHTNIILKFSVNIFFQTYFISNV